MKAVKLSLVIIAAALLTVGLGGMAYAFHSGGVADCSGCHQMHNAPGSASLLIKSDASSTCLSCHMGLTDTGPSSFHVMSTDASMPPGTPPLQRGPGGDFGWLKKTYTWANREGGTDTDPGDSHGHNIIAGDYGYAVDGTNGTAPGGQYVSANLSCVSCHNMHGSYRRLSNGTVSTTGGPIIGSGSSDSSYGNSAAKPIPSGQAVGVYRLLWGGNAGNGANFPGVPAAVAPGTYNRSEATQQVRVAYGASPATGHTSWATWCGTCHSAMLGGLTNHTHPVDQTLGTTIATNYTSYVSSGIMTGSFINNQLNQGPYTSLVPYIEGTGDYTTLGTHAKAAATNASYAPTSTALVSCPSCHRAHAGGFKHMLRWNTEVTFLTETDSAGTNLYWPGTDMPSGDSATTSMGRKIAETKAAYYDRDPLVFGAFQRSLCNKCHAKD